jgi:hypothetical protein
MSEQFSREDLLNAMPDPVGPQQVYIESLGTHVYMKGLDALEQEAYERSLFRFVERDDGGYDTERDTENMRTKFLVLALCDEQGNRLFKDHEHTVLARKRSDVIHEMHDKALRVNGTHPEQVQEEAKNSDGGTAGSSSA